MIHSWDKLLRILDHNCTSNNSKKSYEICSHNEDNHAFKFRDIFASKSERDGQRPLLTWLAKIEIGATVSDSVCVAYNMFTFIQRSPDPETKTTL